MEYGMELKRDKVLTRWMGEGRMMLYTADITFQNDSDTSLFTVQ
jgi:hypothetical protein